MASRALDDLYRAHGAHVYRYALAVLGNHADAEDVTQTTFLNAYRSLEQGVHPRKPANWLLTIASNAIKERFRRDQARPREVELDRDVATSVDDADVPSVGELLTALSKIPPQQRQAIVLREFEGRSYAEIAGILGVTTSALETLLFRARRSLTEELSHQLTCTEAQHAISRAADGRLGRKEKRRLQEHVRECPDCAQFARLQERHSKALRGLALVPVPLSFALFKGLEGSAAAATLPGAASAGTAVGAGAAATGSTVGGSAAASSGGLLAGGVVVKAAAVVAAATVAGGVTVAGIEHVGPLHGHGQKPPASSTVGTPAKVRAGRSAAGKSHVVHSRRAKHASLAGLTHGKAVARGQTGKVPPGQARRHPGGGAKTAGTRQHGQGAGAHAPARPAHNGKSSGTHSQPRPGHQAPAKGTSGGHSHGASTTNPPAPAPPAPAPSESSSTTSTSEPATETPTPAPSGSPPPSSDSSSPSSSTSSSSSSSSASSSSSGSGSTTSSSDAGSSGSSSSSHSSNGQGNAYGHLPDGNGKH